MKEIQGNMDIKIWDMSLTDWQNVIIHRPEDLFTTEKNNKVVVWLGTFWRT